jgi:D-alanyl-D-alanine endopeptidase (penicillin-binding protein 7)
LVKFFKKSLIIGALLSGASLSLAGQPLTAQAWLVADKEGQILEGSHTNEIRSIASITKLMTVMVVLDSGQSILETIPKKLYGKNLSRLNLIELAMIKSDNNAAKMLCEFYPSGLDGCVDAMNRKAFTLGMYNTTFTDPTGLFYTNVSTAQDLIKMVMAASQYETIKEASNKNKVAIPAAKNKYAIFNNTNSLVGNGYDFIVSKTGWITKSGGCIVMMLDTAKGIRTVVLLGSKNTKTRIPEAKMIALAY